VLQLRGDVGVDSIEEVFKLLSRVDVGDVCQDLHLFLKLILQEPVVDPDDPLDVDSTDDILHEIFGMEPGLDQIHTAHKPLLSVLSLLQANVSSRLELGQQFPNGYLVDVPQFFVY
jgi:hypothetical protein